MYCQNCGSELGATSASCARCGAAAAAASDVGLRASELAERARVGTTHAWKALRGFALNPVGGLAPAFAGVAPGQARAVGVVFGVGFVLCFGFGARTAGRGLFSLYGQSELGVILRLALVGLVVLAAQVLSGYAARRLLRGSGHVDGDVFTASAALLPLGVYFLVGGLLGAANFEVVAVLGVFALSIAILMLYTGFRHIAGIADPGATLAVPASIVLSLWLAKVVLVGLA